MLGRTKKTQSSPVAHSSGPSDQKHGVRTDRVPVCGRKVGLSETAGVPRSVVGADLLRLYDARFVRSSGATLLAPSSLQVADPPTAPVSFPVVLSVDTSPDSGPIHHAPSPQQ